MAPEFLEQLLDNLPAGHDPDGRLLCGLSGNEDAAIVTVPPGMALVQTVDVLSPIGDDPYVFGQIAAANALSDVYAMGGQPWCCMNVAFFPSGPKAEAEGLTMDVLGAILRGGIDKMTEAGAVLAGGHTVEDAEPKYGLSVTGIVDPRGYASNRALNPGDTLVLTKPLGTGILSTAVKAKWQGWEEAEKEYTGWAMRLNSNGAEVIRRLGLLAATDVTGFGLGGHSLEMANASQVTIRLQAERIPLMDRVLELAAEGLTPAGSYANKRFCRHQVEFAPQISDVLQIVIFDAQTSGGLLLAVPRNKLALAEALLDELGEAHWLVGEVIPARQDGVFLEIV